MNSTSEKGRTKEDHVTYDKVSWHFPEGAGCASVLEATQHLEVLMNWLACKRLLTDEGLEVLDIGIDSDFALISSMLTLDGNRLLQLRYDDWIRCLEYGKQPNVELLERNLEALADKS